MAICENKKFCTLDFVEMAKTFQTMLFVLWTSNGLKDEHNFNEIASIDAKMCLEVMFWSNERFAGLCFLDLENETFSQHHFHNKLKNNLRFTVR